MAYTMDRILNDARMLVGRLKEHDQTADGLIAQSQLLNSRVESMNEYQEDLSTLNEIARHRPRSDLIMSLVHEGSQIRELQQQNSELQLYLDDHQSALELIMSKYRQQIAQLTQSNKQHKALAELNIPMTEELLARDNKIQEIKAMIHHALLLDDQLDEKDQERMARLYTENEALRKLLKVSQWSGSTSEQADDSTQTESLTNNETQDSCSQSEDDSHQILTTSCLDDPIDEDKDSEISASMSDSFDSQINMSTMRRTRQTSTETDQDICDKDNDQKLLSDDEISKDTDCESISSSFELKVDKDDSQKDTTE